MFHCVPNSNYLAFFCAMISATHAQRPFDAVLEHTAMLKVVCLKRPSGDREGEGEGEKRVGRFVANEKMTGSWSVFGLCGDAVPLSLRPRRRPGEAIPARLLRFARNDNVVGSKTL